MGNLKGKRVESYGDLTLLDLSMHCKNLYELSLAEKMMCYGSFSHMSPVFTIEDICKGYKKSASRKANDLQCIKVKMIKRTRKEAHAWIRDMFNHALQHGMLYDWTTNSIKPLHKVANKNNEKKKKICKMNSWFSNCKVYLKV